jgi:lambda repressor-like predicted transcriptional regulator
VRSVGEKEYEAIIDEKAKRTMKQVPVQEVLDRLKKGESMKNLSKEYNVFWETLRHRLVESIGEEIYKAIIDERCRKPVPIQEALTRLRNGESMKKLSKEYSIDKDTLRRRLVKLIGEEKYEAIINEKAKKARKQVPVREALRGLENGQSVTKLSKEYGVCGKTISSVLQDSIGQPRYREIMDKRRQVPIEKVLRRFNNGEPLEKLSKEYKVCWKRLRNLVVNALGEEEYRNAIRKHRMSVSENVGRRLRAQVPVHEILKKVKSGQSLKRLALEYDVSWYTLKRRLVELIGQDGYKAARRHIRRIRVKPHRVTVGYGSPIARQNGADSLIELEVKTLLESHGIHFKYRQIFEVNGHCYEPDFMFDDNTILEVMGVNHERYWKRCRKKLKDYLENDHKVFAVIWDYVTVNISKYVPKGVSVIKISEFKRNIETYAETLKANNTTINKATISLVGLFRASPKQKGCEFKATVACHKSLALMEALSS